VVTRPRCAHAKPCVCPARSASLPAYERELRFSRDPASVARGGTPAAGAGLAEERAGCADVADCKADDAVVADLAGGLLAENPDIADVAVGNVERDGKAVGASPRIRRHDDVPASVMGGAGEAGSASGEGCGTGGAEDEESRQSFHQ